MVSHAFFSLAKKVSYDPLIVFCCTFSFILLGFSLKLQILHSFLVSFFILCSLIQLNSSSIDPWFFIFTLFYVNFFVSCSLIFIFIMPPRAVPAHLQLRYWLCAFVHPNEWSNSLTVSPKLNGSKYLAWNRSMQCASGRRTS